MLSCVKQIHHRVPTHIVACGSVVLWLMVTLGGCAADQSTASIADRDTASERIGESNASQETDNASDGDDLAAHIQRDVDAFLSMREQSDNDTADTDANPVAGSETGTDQATQKTDKPKQPKIIWNTPRSNNASDETAETRSASDSDADGDGDDATNDALVSADEISADDGEQATPPRLQAPDDENEPVAEDSAEDRRIRQLLVELSRALYRESTYDDMPLRQLLMISATTMVSPDRALQVDALNSLTDRERELLGAFQDFFISVGKDLDGSRAAEPVLTEAVERLQRAIVRQPQLQIPTFALCTQVSGFADYQKFDPYRFLAHNGQQAVVYTEVDEFASELNDKGEWVTELSQQLTIYSHRDGIPVWQLNWQPAVDRSRKKRQDFFITQLITLPDALGVGKYNLKVRLRDEKSGAEAERSISIEMVADPKLAAEVQ